ncbi:MAG: hypothetical protein ACXVDZ_18190 [Bacteroidia bacterium]
MENEAVTRRYKIPQDVLMDIFRILIGNKIKYRIEGIKEKENLLLVQVDVTNAVNNLTAHENILEILKDYSEFMDGLLKETLYADEDQEEEEYD